MRELFFKKGGFCEGELFCWRGIFTEEKKWVFEGEEELL